MGYNLHDYGIPRGHRGIKTNVNIALVDEDGDHFSISGFDFVRISFIWDSPQASIVRHTYQNGELGLTFRFGHIFMERFNVPLHGQIELIVQRANFWERMYLDAGSPVNEDLMILGRCPIHPQRQQTLQIQARRVGFTASESNQSGYSSAETTGGQVGISGSDSGVGFSLSGQVSATDTTSYQTSRTITRLEGLGRFEMTQI